MVQPVMLNWLRKASCWSYVSALARQRRASCVALVCQQCCDTGRQCQALSARLACIIHDVLHTIAAANANSQSALYVNTCSRTTRKGLKKLSMTISKAGVTEISLALPRLAHLISSVWSTSSFSRADSDHRKSFAIEHEAGLLCLILCHP